MMKRIIATATALGVLCLPASPVLAGGYAAQQSNVLAHGTGRVAPQASAAEMIEDTIFEMTAQIVSERGYDVGMTAGEEAALTAQFGAEIFDNALPISVGFGEGLRALVVIPLDGAVEASDVPMGIFKGQHLEGAYRVMVDGDVARIARPDGMALADVPLMAGAEGMQVDLRHGATIFAIDLPDFSLTPIIEALQSVLDLLYTVKSVLNSIICAVQAAVDLIYGLTACGVGQTQVGGGEILGNVQCSVPRVQNFIQTVSGYCF